MELTCPKCHGTMRTYERNGVHVDQCSDCRGIFLDRGELERLVDAENAWRDRPAAGRGTASQPAPGSAGHTPSAGAGLGAGGLGAVVGEVLGQVQGKKHGSAYGHGGKRKQSFLGDLFG